MSLRTIIIDDELDSLELLQHKIKEYCPQLEIIGATQSPEEGIDLINAMKPDVLFLDIEMPRMNGFRLLKSLERIEFEIIFTTAYSHYAIEAVRLSAFDYLTKPIAISDLQNCIERLILKKSNNPSRQLEILDKTLSQPKSQENRIVVSTLESIEFVIIKDIIYLQADSNYTKFHLQRGQSLLVAKNLGEFDALLTNHGFFRPHHSYLINLAHVVKLIKDDGGYIEMNNGAKVDVSRRKKDDFLNAMKEFGDSIQDKKY